MRMRIVLLGSSAWFSVSRVNLARTLNPLKSKLKKTLNPLNSAERIIKDRGKIFKKKLMLKMNIHKISEEKQRINMPNKGPIKEDW